MNKIQSVVIAWPDEMDRFEFSRHNTSEANTLNWKCDPSALPQPIVSVPANLTPKPALTIPIGSLMGLAIAFFCLRIPKHSLRLLLSGASLILAIAIWKTAGMKIDHPWQQPAELSQDDATAIFQQLHQGTYRSLDFGSEDRVYDVLATSVDGRLLEQLYLQLRQSLEMREQNGAVARIQSIEYDQGEQRPRESTTVAWPGFEYQSAWTIAGTVEHWGHIHERKNRFDAIFTIEPRDGSWKITRMDVTDQQQVGSRTRLR